MTLGPSNPPPGPDVPRRVGLVGLGQIGLAVAELVFGQGLPLTVWTRRRAAGEAFLADARRRVARQVRRGRIAEHDGLARLERLRLADLADLGGADLAIEAISEDARAKRAILERLAEACGPDAILASTTSEIPLEKILPDSGAGARALGLHFLAPVRLTTAVELIPGPTTAPAVLDRAGAWCRTLGREPFVFRRSAVNPMLVAYVAEGLSLCLEGVPPERVDAELLGAGFGLGPLATLDLIGLDVAHAVLERQDGLSPRLDRGATGILEALLECGHLGRKSGRGVFVHDGEGSGRFNPRFESLLAETGRRCAKRCVVDRVWLRLVNEFLLCLSARVGSAEAIDRVVSEVLGLEQGLRARIAASDAQGLAAELVRLEQRLGNRHRPSPEALRAV